MKRKVMVSIIGLIITFGLFFIIWKIVGSTKSTDENININEFNNTMEISKQEVIDECTEEWEEYNNELQRAFEEASNNLGEDDTQYLIRSENGYINVYYLDENKGEYLYKKTNISTDYLSQKDIDDLEVGIEVIGSEALNSMLEDFE